MSHARLTCRRHTRSGQLYAPMGVALLLSFLALGGCRAVSRPLLQPTPSGPGADSEAREAPMPQTVYAFSARRLSGADQLLSEYRGQVLLIVNTASKCGLTPQYAGLQQLHDDYHERGLTVLGFPCNQFANQEPGTEEEIASFCTLNYGVSFPMFAPIDVNGDHTHPLYAFLKDELPGLLSIDAIKWNFTKFLVDASGRPIKRYAPRTEPDDIRADIEAVLTP